MDSLRSSVICFARLCFGICTTVVWCNETTLWFGLKVNHRTKKARSNKQGSRSSNSPLILATRRQYVHTLKPTCTTYP